MSAYHADRLMDLYAAMAAQAVRDYHHPSWLRGPDRRSAVAFLTAAGLIRDGVPDARIVVSVSVVPTEARGGVMSRLSRWLCRIGLHRLRLRDGTGFYWRKAVPYVCAWCGAEVMKDQSNHEWYP